MARQRAHNRRAGRGMNTSGSSWISYSDMMAALVLVFVLFLTYNLYQYNTVLEQKTLEIEAQKLQLDEKDGADAEELHQGHEACNPHGVLEQGELNAAQANLVLAQDELKTAQDELSRQTIILIGKQQELEDAKTQLASKEEQLALLQITLGEKEKALMDATRLLEAQRNAFAQQTDRISTMVGVRGEIIQELSAALAVNQIGATVDPNTGDIVLESTVFFESNRSEIKPEGKALLDNFLPIYLDVLLKDEYRGYLGEIIVEGHTDSSGTWLKNLRLSQDRAQTVAEYCYAMPTLTASQKALLQTILTAKGRSSNDLIYNGDGTENKDASRRVEFKFSLRDSEMIDEMRSILDMTADDLPPAESSMTLNKPE